MKYILAILTFWFTIFNVNAQKTIDTNNDFWYLLLGNYEINNKWSLGSEIHYRTADWGSEKQQLLLRPFINYAIKPNVKLTFGYTHIETYPYGKQAIGFRTPENNFWVQALINQKLGNINTSHRYRLEQRWTSNVSTGSNGERTINGTTHRNRLRYRFTMKKNISDNNKFYAKIFDEIWVNFGENKGANIFDQNWLYGGIGYKMTHKTAIEIAYQWQIINKSDGIREESNNTIQMTLNYKLKMSKKKAPSDSP